MAIQKHVETGPVAISNAPAVTGDAPIPVSATRCLVILEITLASVPATPIPVEQLGGPSGNKLFPLAPTPALYSLKPRPCVLKASVALQSTVLQQAANLFQICSKSHIAQTLTKTMLYKLHLTSFRLRLYIYPV